MQSPRAAPVAHVQRAGGVGGHEFDHHAAPAGGLVAETLARGQHLGHHGLARGGGQAQVDEAGAGDLERLHPALHGGLRLQRLQQRRGDIARIRFQRPGQRHGRGDGQVAMRGLPWGLQHRGRHRRIAQAGGHLGQG